MAGPGEVVRARLGPHLPKVRRAGWNIVDQGLSALTNVALSFVVARNVDAAGFGAFAVAFLVFSLLIGLQRALVGQPLSIRHSHVTGPVRRRVAREAFGTVLALVLPVSVGVVVASRFVTGPLQPTLLALAVALPFLLLQDTCRMAFFAWAKPQLATLNDLVWTVAQFAAIAAVVLLGRSSTWALVLCWGLGAAVAAAVGMVQLRVVPGFARVWAWVREHRDLVGYLLAEYLLGVGAFQGGILLVGGALGVSDIGSLRGAQVLIGPLGVVSAALITFGVPEVSRRGRLPRRVLLLAASGSAAMIALTLLYTVLLLLIPESVGTALLGDTWSGSRGVLVPIALGSAFAALKMGPVIFIYGLGLARKSVRLVALLAVLAVVFMAVGARAGQAAGLAWGMALAQLAVGPLWFWQLRRIERDEARRRRGSPAPHAPATADAPGREAAVDLRDATVLPLRRD